MSDKADLIQYIVDPLNRQQKNAVTSEAQYLRVLAGAGSGKTRVIVHRIAWILATGKAHSANVLAVTFTNKAASEMRKRIEQLLDTSAANFWMGTFHSTAHRILRRHFSVLNLPENFQIIDSDDQHRLIKRLIKELGFDEEECEPKRAQAFINKQKDEGRRVKDVLPSPMTDVAMFTEVYRAYENACRRSGMVDFAEILLLAFELWRDHADVLAHYRDQFTTILVDEFQDTNTIQYRWISLLLGPNNSMTIVGDDDQSIYGWRGARVENIHRFSQDHPGTQTIRLEQNYRSTQTILKTANQLIAHNQERLGKELWTEHTQGEPITLYGGFSETDEAKFIVDRAHKWLESGGELNDIAILYRSNAQSRVLEQALLQANLPYRVYGGLRFFDRAEIKDVLAYLRLMVNVDDDTALERVINMPPRGIGERTLLSLREVAKAQGVSLWQATKQMLTGMKAGRIRNGLLHFIQTVEALTEQVGILPLPQLTETTLNHSGLVDYIRSQPGDRTHIRLENLTELIEATREFHKGYEEKQGKAPTSVQCLPDFLSEVALDAGEKEGEKKDEPSIKLMTLHSAKGLEFPLVFMAGMEDGLFPHHRCTEKQSLLEEERRLCYVGITRAMQKLYLTYAERRTFAGLAGNTRRPSRFVNELPKHLIETVNLNINITPPASRQGLPKSVNSKIRNLPYELGQRVRHERFGVGVVMCGEGEGEAARIQIKFEKAGPKWLSLAYAKLEALS